MKLIIIRHGESQAACEGIGLGQMDGDLSQKGLWQSRLLAQRLKREKLDAIFTSPLQRALHTARHIASAHSCQLIVDDRLKERKMGIFEGRSKQIFNEASASFPQVSYAPPGGESIEEVAARARIFYTDLRKYKFQNVVIASHNFLNKALLSVILDRPLQETLNYAQDHACINIIEIDEASPEVRCIKINDTTHLEDNHAVRNV